MYKLHCRVIRLILCLPSFLGTHQPTDKSLSLLRLSLYSTSEEEKSLTSAQFLLVLVYCLGDSQYIIIMMQYYPECYSLSKPLVWVFCRNAIQSVGSNMIYFLQLCTDFHKWYTYFSSRRCSTDIPFLLINIWHGLDHLC